MGYRPPLTDEDIQYIRDRYELDGPKKCAEHIGCSSDTVRAWAKRLGLRGYADLNWPSRNMGKITGNYLWRNAAGHLRRKWSDPFTNTSGNQATPTRR